ncbi:MAG: thioredoxin family protein [Alphaproteobacteria bacterium]
MTPIKTAKLLSIFILASICTCVQALASFDNPAEIEIISKYDAIGDSGVATLGLLIKLDSGYKVQSPQEEDLAEAPEITWTTQENISAISLHWPTPMSLSTPLGPILGYQGEVIVPISVKVIDSSKPVVLEGSVSLVACGTLCIPVTRDISFTLPPGPKSPTVYAEFISEEMEEIDEADDFSTLLWMMLFAFAGGLILNLMPCVLPILSMKLVTFTSASRMEIYQRCRWTLAGVMVSFGLIALSVSALRTLGIAVGWGFHFQEPYFISFMVMLTAVFSMNLWGLFEVGYVPNIDLKHKVSAPKEFISGLFATLLATPCTAPFLGAAVGFAISQDTVCILAIFLSAGLGFGFPYVVLPYTPFRLPKPGQWLTTFKRVLAVGMFVTCLWLMWLLGSNLGQLYLYLSLGLFVISAVAIALRKRGKLAAYAGGLSLTLLAVLPGLPIHTPQPQLYSNNSRYCWEVFDENLIQAHVQSGNTVFLDITADWCLTCKFNKVNTIETDATEKLFDQYNIVLMQADWTQRDDKILAFMQQYQRAGVPLNIIFSPENPEGIVLPEILTYDKLLSVLDGRN